MLDERGKWITESYVCLSDTSQHVFVHDQFRSEDEDRTNHDGRSRESDHGVE